MTAARRPRSLVARLVALGAAAALAGCAAAASSSDPGGSAPSGTVDGVGKLPGSLSGATATATAGSQTGTTTQLTTNGTDSVATVSSDGSLPPTVDSGQTIGTDAAGNRLLMIGDSVTAAISKRYGNQACQDLVPLGWRVEVDAETSKFIEFGKTVLDDRLSAGWDAAVLFLGNNFNGDQAAYQSALHALLYRLVPRPVVLITTSVFRDSQTKVNDVILAEAAMFSNVTVLDWSTISVDPSLTGADNLHLTEKGRATLAYYIAGVLGPAPAQPGACLDSKFTDDSGGSPDGPAGNLTKPKKPRPVVPVTTTTTIVKTSTSVRSTSTSSSTETTQPSSTSAASTSSPTTAGPTTTHAPTTSAAPTTAPAGPTTSRPGP